jgi:hypothetical protein
LLPFDDPLPDIEPEPLPVTLPDPEFMLPLLVPLRFMLPELELLPADPTSNGCPCCAACRLCPFRRSISLFCEVSAWPRDERIACADERSVSREAVFERFALVEFMPVVDVPVWSVPADECIVSFVLAWFVPFIGLLASFMPVFVVVSLGPVLALPLLFMPVILPLAFVSDVAPLLLFMPVVELLVMPVDPFILLPLFVPAALSWVAVGGVAAGPFPVLD